MTDAEKLRRLEDRLWKAADQLRANSSLAASQYSIPVLGLTFLRYADVRARWPRRRGRWERLTFLDLPEDVDPSGGRFSKGYETE